MGKACRKILMDLREAIGGTCPGDPRYLLLCQKMAQAWRNLAVATKNTGNTEIYMMSSYVRERAEEQSKKACICVYGQQKPHVVKAIMSKYSNKGIL